MSQLYSLPDRRPLVDCAMARIPADTVVVNARWVCVQSGEIVPDTMVAILGERVAYVGPKTDLLLSENTRFIDAQGDYLVPGLLDGHMHVESGMLTVTEYVRAVGVRGTTGMFIDPHEIGNVFGLNGVKLMADEAAMQPIHVFVQVPSCVPSAPGFESPGATIGAKEVEQALAWDNIVGLGEMMNYPGVYMNDEEVHEKMAQTRRSGKVIGGHYSTHDLGNPFHGYAAGGPGDDHEGTRTEDAVQRIRQGMYVMMRQGSGWHDVATLSKAITELRLDSRRFILCNDDTHSHTLISEGHMDRVVRFAISQGLNPMQAIQMATINTAERFGLDEHLGMIAPGRYADLLLVKDLSQFRPRLVIAKGREIACDGKWSVELPAISYPQWTRESVHLTNESLPEHFRILMGEPLIQQVRTHVIGVTEGQAPTRHLLRDLVVVNGEVSADLRSDLAKIAVLDRHHDSGRIVLGFVSGFGLTEPCAIASTVAHDCHQMLVVGTRDSDMAQAVNKLREIQGGQVVVRNGQVIGLVPLPIAGLMSIKNAETVSRESDSVLAGIRACGCQFDNANMQLSLLSLVVIPELRLSDLGLFDAVNFCFIPLFEQERLHHE